MSYISAFTKGKNVVVWRRHENGDRTIQKIDKDPYHYYYASNSGGDKLSIYNDKVSKVLFSEAKPEQLHNPKLDVKFFETDMQPHLRYLSKTFYNKPAPKLHVSFYDIEVDFDKHIGFAGSLKPYAIINSVAIYHAWKNEYVIIAVPPKEYTGDEHTITEDMAVRCGVADDVKISISLVSTEKELLFKLLTEVDESDALVGWNSDGFDLPYVCSRIAIVLDNLDIQTILDEIVEEMDNDINIQNENPDTKNPVIKRIRRKISGNYTKRMCFDGGVDPVIKTTPNDWGGYNIVWDISGRISGDYMLLFKKYEMAERPSYKLESIADEFLPELPKLSYDGSLADLYRNDFPYFIRYNLRDTEILKGFEEKLGYMELANQMYHLSTGTWEHVLGTLKLAELAAVNYCHYELDRVVNNIPSIKGTESIQGAYVLEPKIGMHQWAGSIDIASLYPSSIRSLNISPEKIIGQFDDKENAVIAMKNNSLELIMFRQNVYNYVDGRYTSNHTKFEDSVLELPAVEWKRYLIKNKWAVSGFGTVFDQEEKGIIPAILENWYAKRTEYKVEMKKYKEQADELSRLAEAAGNNATPKELQVIAELRTKTTYYDKLQYIYKIKLNSFYGALANKYFRFYDLRMGESTTGTGRMILKHQCAEANRVLKGVYDQNGEAIIYGDTDSAYFKTYAQNKEQAIEIADGVGYMVNQSFQSFMQETFYCTEGFDNIISAEREIVSDRGIFIDKKRYILHLVDSDGYPVDKMKTMGIELKKTTLPKEVSKKLSSFIEQLLKGAEWDDIAAQVVEYKQSLETTNDIMLIGLPKGIKKVEKYTHDYNTQGDKARLPGHIAAALFWNKYKDKINDHESMNITSGMKIKVFYLKGVFMGRFKSVAVPVDIEQLPPWFTKEFIPLIDRDAQISRLVDGPLNNIFKAIGRVSPTKQSVFLDDILDF